MAQTSSSVLTVNNVTPFWGCLVLGEGQGTDSSLVSVHEYCTAGGNVVAQEMRVTLQPVLPLTMATPD